MPTTFEEVRSEVFALVLEMAPEPPPGAADVAAASFVDDLGYHSVALVELGIAIEERFLLDPILAEDVEDVLTADDLARFVSDRLGIAP
jgi:acyl carrier protein